jgi:hypothetical protein
MIDDQGAAERTKRGRGPADPIELTPAQDVLSLRLTSAVIASDGEAVRAKRSASPARTTDADRLKSLMLRPQRKSTDD